MIPLDLLNVGIVEETGSILLVLRAAAEHRLLVIETGLLEGQAVALEAGGVRSDRPLMHDLMHDMIVGLGARVKAVHIHDFHDETYFARLVLSKPDGSPDIELDSRPSDAIALALRGTAPIFVADKVLADMGVPEERDGRFHEMFEENGDDAPRIIH